MPNSFVYSPSCEIHLQTADGTIYDVSEDITQATVQRIINGVSTVQLTLANAGRKYDNLFSEMDKIAVYLTRVRKLLVFTGYLSMVPAYSSNPVSVNLQASCTLKRLQNWYWDPTTSAAQTLLYSPSNSQQRNLTDGGLSKKTIDLLTTVCGWPKAQIHIGAVPKGWFDSVQSVADQVIAEADQLTLIATVGNSGYVNGINPYTSGKASIPGIGKGTGNLPYATGGLATYDSPDDFLDSKASRPSGAYFITMPWPYLQSGSPVGGHASGVVAVPGVDVGKARAWWMGRLILLVNPKNNKAVCVRASGWGPAADANLSRTATRVVGSTSQQVMNDLGVVNGSLVDVHIAFAPDGMKAGKVDTSGQGVDPTQATELATSSSGAAGGSASSTAVKFANVAAAWATSANVDYGWGDGHGRSLDGSNTHPGALDCSGLVNWSLARIGKYGDNTAAGWQSKTTAISVEEARKTKGALVFLVEGGSVGHVGISMGDGTTAEARTQGEVGTYPFSGAHSNHWTLAGKIPMLDYAGATLSGTGGTPGKFNNSGGTGTGTDSTTSTSSSLDGNIGTALFNVWQWIGNNSFGGQLLAGARALMNDEPVMNTVDSLMTTGLRQYCSAPNGDFIGWFPDYFGWWGTAGKMIIQPIEIMQNFAVARSDTNLKTHWFVTSASSGVAGDANTIVQESSTAGIASVEMPGLMKALFRVGNEFDDNGQEFLARFGARPQFEQMDNITGHQQEFFFSVFRFMLNWASRYTAPINVTFMPELYPGMLAVFPSLGIQCYVQEVTHTINLRSGGGFTTSFNGIAWSSIGKKSTIEGLPIGATL